MGRLFRPGERFAAPPPRLARPPKVADRELLSQEWRELVASRRKDADYRAGCARCGSKQHLRLDHVVERKDGGAKFDRSNTQWLCNACNVAKGAEARRRRVGLR